MKIQLDTFTKPKSIAVIGATAIVQPNMLTSLQSRPWLAVLMLLAAGSIYAARRYRLSGSAGKAFLASCLYLYAMMASGASWVYPDVLPGRESGAGLTAAAAATAEATLVQTLYWWVPGMCIALLYTWIVYRAMPEKFLVGDEAVH